MKPSEQQKEIIHKLIMEIAYWKHGLATDKLITDFVKHEVIGLSGEQENQLINILCKMNHLIQTVE